MPEQTFRFKCMKERPLFEADLPKLPPRAHSVMLDVLKQHGAEPGAPLPPLNKARESALIVDMACALVHLTLKRLDKSVSLAQVTEDEDLDEVLACFQAVVNRNPALFPKKKAEPAPLVEVPTDPPSARSVPVPAVSAPSAT